MVVAVLTLTKTTRWMVDNINPKLNPILSTIVL